MDGYKDRPFRHTVYVHVIHTQVYDTCSQAPRRAKTIMGGVAGMWLGQVMACREKGAGERGLDRQTGRVC